MPVNHSTLSGKPLSFLRRNSHSKQLGASAIEFALVFPIFFALFYAIVGYSLVMTLQQSMTQASKDGIRAAIQANPTSKNYLASAETLARSAITQSLKGLPDGMRSNIKTNVSVVSTSITVTLTYPYSENPILPILTLPVIGNVPNIPDNLIVKSNGQL